MGISKSGFGAGFGSLAVPLMALAVTVPQAAAILMPVLLLVDLLGLAAFRRNFDAALLKFLIPFGLVGIVLGALLAAGLASKFVPGWRISRRHLAAAVVGGLLLGYGARLAYGCNIGAFFSGIASGSLHGWLWIVFALAGNWVALSLRPLFNLPVTVTPRQGAC